MTRREEVAAHFREVVQTVLDKPDPIALALHERGLGPKPATYSWGSTSVTKKKGRPRGGNGAGASAEDAAEEAP